MKRSTLHATTAALAFASMFSLGTAQAAMGPCFLIMSNPANATSCTSAQPNLPAPMISAPTKSSCPTQSGAGTGCMSNQELGQALGSMAAGGMQIAATVMRAVTEEASRLLMADPDM